MREFQLLCSPKNVWPGVQSSQSVASSPVKSTTPQLRRSSSTRFPSRVFGASGVTECYLDSPQPSTIDMKKIIAVASRFIEPNLPKRFFRNLQSLLEPKNWREETASHETWNHSALLQHFWNGCLTRL